MFPLELNEIFAGLGYWGPYLLYFALGIGFGWALESSGFAISTRLAAQFYFKDLTVLKVMFTAIVVAMLLVFLTSALGLLDYNAVWVNPTYLLPGIVGGLIMGVGFIIGGFCPGTSLVATATGKLDGVLFTLGALFGMFAFGETVGFFNDFYHSTNKGRLTLQDVLNVDAGVVALGVVIMALVVFFLGEQAERIIGKQDQSTRPRWRYGAAGGVLVLGAAVVIIGQPTTADRWTAMAAEKEQLLQDRQVQIHPAELLGLMHDYNIEVYSIDVRSETDYNAFHLRDAHHMSLAEVEGAIPTLLMQPYNTVFVVVSSDETDATAAWRTMTANSVPNVYILEGGMNNWVDTFASDELRSECAIAVTGDDIMRYSFATALGDRLPVANPNPHAYEFEFESKVTPVAKSGAKVGGCG